MVNPEIARKVILFGLGGTIAMSDSDSGGVTPTLTADQLLSAVPGLADSGIAVAVVDFRAVASASLRFGDIHALAAAIRERLDDVDGVVVTQGTDTIEETAYLLDLLHDAPQPVVVTGAMRNPTLAGPDGPANVLAAIQVAASPAARDQGCLVVFADEIHAAHRVAKQHTTSVATFRSPNGGPLGYLVEGRPRILNRIDWQPVRAALPAAVPAVPAASTNPESAADSVRVGLLIVTFDDDLTVCDALAGQVAGLVVAGLGGGHVAARAVPALAALAERIPVVLASRTGAGSVLAATYGFPGSELDLLGRGLISAGLLHPYKARILLHTLLSAGADLPTIRSTFAALC